MAGGSVRREIILNAAAKLFAEKGVAATTVREIAIEVGILSGSLYHHFDSKASMVEEIIVSYVDDLRERYRAASEAITDPRQLLSELVRESFATVEAHPYATEIYQKDHAYLRGLPNYEYLRKAAADIQQTFLTVIAAGVRSGAFRDDVPPEVFYRFIRDAIWLSVRWFKPTRSYPMARLAEDYVSLFLDGVGARASGRGRRRGA